MEKSGTSTGTISAPAPSCAPRCPGAPSEVHFGDFKIAIFTRSMHWHLFEMLKATLKLPFPHYRMIDTTAEGYLYRILEHSDIDFAINIDEDAFVVDNDAILDLLRHCVRENIVSCGMPDGGMVPVRVWNPVVISPFFTIMNVATIRKSFSLKQIEKYSQGVSIDYEKFLPKNLPGAYRTDIQYEPFEPFYLWLNTNFKTEYLIAETHQDGFTTILKNHLGNPMVHHTWYSRKYKRDKIHTQRIDNIFNACKPAGFHFTLLDKIKAALDFLNIKITKRKRNIKEIFRRANPTTLEIRP